MTTRANTRRNESWTIWRTAFEPNEPLCKNNRITPTVQPSPLFTEYFYETPLNSIQSVRYALRITPHLRYHLLTIVGVPRRQTPISICIDSIPGLRIQGLAPVGEVHRAWAGDSLITQQLWKTGQIWRLIWVTTRRPST